MVEYRFKSLEGNTEAFSRRRNYQARPGLKARMHFVSVTCERLKKATVWPEKGMGAVEIPDRHEVCHHRVIFVIQEPSMQVKTWRLNIE